MKDKIKRLVEERVKASVGNSQRGVSELREVDKEVITRRKNLINKRSAEIVKCNASTQIISRNQVEDQLHLTYLVHYHYLIKQFDKLYLEEQCEQRKAVFLSEDLIDDYEMNQGDEDSIDEDLTREVEVNNRVNYVYDRLAAVKYAERWWNSYNPKYKKFEVDCTNFVSQCAHAGGAPMTGYPDRGSGWWMQNNTWSYSWSVAHSFRWYLAGSKSGLRAIEVESAKDLLLGDIIAYDFEGDGRYNHTTIVVGKDGEGMPLVNAHTTNSRMRYWSYEDSTAYTPNIKYKFFSVMDR